MYAGKEGCLNTITESLKAIAINKRALVEAYGMDESAVNNYICDTGNEYMSRIMRMSVSEFANYVMEQSLNILEKRMKGDAEHGAGETV